MGGQLPCRLGPRPSWLGVFWEERPPAPDGGGAHRGHPAKSSWSVSRARVSNGGVKSRRAGRGAMISRRGTMRWGGAGVIAASAIAGGLLVSAPIAGATAAPKYTSHAHRHGRHRPTTTTTKSHKHTTSPSVTGATGTTTTAPYVIPTAAATPTAVTPTTTPVVGASANQLAFTGASPSVWSLGEVGAGSLLTGGTLLLWWRRRARAAATR